MRWFHVLGLTCMLVFLGINLSMGDWLLAALDAGLAVWFGFDVYKDWIGKE